MLPRGPILITGCGIAGPVLALLLHQKGYKVIVFDKVSQPGDAGASLMLMSNGLKVLDLVGVAAAATAQSIPIDAFIDRTSTGHLLGTSQLPSSFPKKYSHPLTGIKRTSLHLLLRESLLQRGIDVRQGWTLLGFEEDEREGSVTAHFDGDRRVAGSILVGCDGIKSATRAAMLRLGGVAEPSPLYTGLTQTAGIAKTPPDMSSAAAMRNWYGDGIHVISYPISETHTSWAMTRREAQETTESWRPYRPDELPQQRAQLCALLQGWDRAVLDMVGSSERIIKFGLFDRQELRPDQWFSRRSVLVGDAAHPTSPHLGQGANQALEDCYHLSQAFPNLHALKDEDNDADSDADTVAPFGPGIAGTIFRPFAEKRQPRTAHLVRGARLQGDQRVVAGQESCRVRDGLIVDKFADSQQLADRFDELLREPF
ncbi:hypothetical protein E4U42_002289 [Claviceps africana]|uniref:FAD-binding domain-containing protein n=1 Tax=Claviceps africana TaxID=83212 RepID=A0A8K0NME7_9HYPO|nr:hypothetical protein E4U42_002289 [Claviceps africana]